MEQWARKDISNEIKAAEEFKIQLEEEKTFAIIWNRTSVVFFNGTCYSSMYMAGTERIYSWENRK